MFGCHPIHNLFIYRKCIHYSDMKKALTKREIRTTWTLFLVCFCYFLFVMPIALVNIIDFKSNSPQIHLALFCLYWLQYSLNFFIYAARSEQYRKAYSYFLWKVFQHYFYMRIKSHSKIKNRLKLLCADTKKRHQQLRHCFMSIRKCCRQFWKTTPKLR